MSIHAFKATFGASVLIDPRRETLIGLKPLQEIVLYGKFGNNEFRCPKLLSLSSLKSDDVCDCVEGFNGRANSATFTLSTDDTWKRDAQSLEQIFTHGAQKLFFLLLHSCRRTKEGVAEASPCSRCVNPSYGRANVKKQFPPFETLVRNLGEGVIASLSFCIDVSNGLTT